MVTPLPTTRSSLILRLQDPGDIAAWDIFVRLYTPVLLRIAERFGMQPADRENLVQEVLLAVSQAVPQWLRRADRGPFRAWILTIARNEAVDLLTRRTSQPLNQRCQPLEDASGAERLVHDSVLSSVDWEYRRELFQWAASEVRKVVSPTTWNAFAMTTLEGRSIQEVSAFLKMRPGAVYLARGRVMNRIKKFVSEWEETS